MGELKFNRYEGFIGGGTGTKFIDENFKVCPMCHTHEPHWYTASEMHGAGTSRVFSESFGYVRCDKCKAIYKHLLLDILKFTDSKYLRTPLGRRVDPGSMDVNDIEMEIYDGGLSFGANDYVGRKFTVRMMNADILRIDEGHIPNPAPEAHAEAHASSAITYIKDSINNETVRDIQEKKEQINNGVCPNCQNKFNTNNQDIQFCLYCGYRLKDPAERPVCLTCGSTLDDNGVCPNCTNYYGVYNASNVNYQAPKNEAIKYSGLSIEGFIVSLAGLLIFAVPCGVVSVILFALGLKEVNDKKLKGNGFAISGLVVGIVDILFGLLAIIGVFSILGSF